jgi:hypothetical protein
MGSEVVNHDRWIAHLGRQGMRRLKEIADGRSHSIICWPKTFERLVECGFAELVEHRITHSQFAKITDAGRLALAQAQRTAKDGGGDRG